MEHIGTHNDRKVFYTNIWRDDNWLQNMPTKNWAVFPIGEIETPHYYLNLAEKCIDNNVLYVCAAGDHCEAIHDIFDEVIYSKKISKGESIDSPDDFENSPMTTWHHNFSEGFWFALVVTHHDSGPIEKIVCVDFTRKGVKMHLQNLIEKTKSTWLPSDAEKEEPVYDNESGSH